MVTTTTPPKLASFKLILNSHLSIMDMPTAPFLPNEKVYSTVIIDFIPQESLTIQFDNAKWRISKLSTNFSWTELDSKIDAILEECLKGTTGVVIRELVIKDWFGNPFRFQNVTVQKLSISITSIFYEKGFLKVFDKKSLTHLSVRNGLDRDNFMDDVKTMDIEFLLIRTIRLKDKERALTGFKAKNWDVSEDFSFADDEQKCSPLLFHYTEKMLCENSPIGCMYFGDYASPIDKQPIIDCLKQKYPAAETETVGDVFLTVDLGQKSVYVFEMPPKRLSGCPYAYGVKIDRRGLFKKRHEMTRRDRIVEKYTKVVIFLVSILAPIVRHLNKNYPKLPIARIAGFIDFLLVIPLVIIVNFIFMLTTLTFVLVYPNTYVLLLILCIWCMFNFYARTEIRNHYKSMHYEFFNKFP